MQHYHSRDTSEPPSPTQHPPASLPSIRSRPLAHHQAFPSSATWTSSSADQAVSDTDEIEDRTRFVVEYNRLAKKHYIRSLVLEDFQHDQRNATPNNMTEKRHWWSRLLRSVSHGRHRDSSRTRVVRQRRSLSDLAIHLKQAVKERPKTLTLQAMVRLNGQSLLYLPAEFAVGSLRVPTCFRATGQYLAQHGTSTRGIFRIPGSVRVVNALFDYYCHEDDDEEVMQTTRCPDLPIHITIVEHDVGSTFKKFLGVLPGGILGSLSVFDALVAIHSQLHGDPEHNRTRQTKLRARLIALAISTVKSQFQRDLIYAVFGLLSLIGREAEMAPREDAQGHPLPTSDLMGYKALGIVFGPLLVGHLLDSYTMKLAHPPTGLLLFPLTPPKLKRERSENLAAVAAEGPPTVNKILVVNDITEMIITHWREVVRQLKNLNALDSQGQLSIENSRKRYLSSSASEAFTLRKPQSWGFRRSAGDGGFDEDLSKIPSTPTPSSKPGILKHSSTPHSLNDSLHVKRSRPRNSPSGSSVRDRISARQSVNLLSPTAEESQPGDDHAPTSPKSMAAGVTESKNGRKSNPKSSPRGSVSKIGALAAKFSSSPSKDASKPIYHQDVDLPRPRNSVERTSNDSSRAKIRDADSSPSRKRERHKSLPAKPGLQTHVLCRSNSNDSTGEFDEQTPFYSGSPVRSVPSNKKRSSAPTPTPGVVTDRLRRLVQAAAGQESLVKDKDRRTSGKIWIPSARNNIYEGHAKRPSPAKRPSGSPNTLDRKHDINTIMTSTRELTEPSGSQQERSPILPRIVTPSNAPDSNQHMKGEAYRQQRSSSIQTTPERFLRNFNSPMQEPHALPTAESTDSVDLKEQSDVGPTSGSCHADNRDNTSNSYSAARMHHQTGPEAFAEATDNRYHSVNRNPSQPKVHQPPKPRSASVATVADKVAEIAQRNSSSTALSAGSLRKRSSTLAVMKPPTTPQSGHTKPNRVRAMAALWEATPTKAGPSASPAASMVRKQSDDGAHQVVSPYATNTTPSRQPPPTVKLTSDRSPSKGSNQPIGRGAHPRSEGPKKALRTAASDSTTLRVTAGCDGHAQKHGEKSEESQLGSTSKVVNKQKSLQSFPGAGDHFNSDNPPSLGKMVPHQEQPPVDKHINFSRPPSGTSLRTVNEPEDECVEASDHVTSSPLLSGGNCVLHAQIRNLTKQLEARAEEVSSLRRQLETKENMDVGTLSEQLRESKRECAMWRSRAEAAERRIAVFERFTSKLRGIRGSKTERRPPSDGVRKPSGQSAATVEKNTLENGSEASADTSRTEEPGTLASRIRHSLRDLDGAQSEGIGGSTSPDGVAGAWWNASSKALDGRSRGERSGLSASSREDDWLPISDMNIVQSAEDILMVTDEFLAHEDLVDLVGGC